MWGGSPRNSMGNFCLGYRYTKWRVFDKFEGKLVGKTAIGYMNGRRFQNISKRVIQVKVNNDENSTVFHM